MAIDKAIPEVYVFYEDWYRWSYQFGQWISFVPPKPHGKYTGIGSRPKNLSSKGIKAIHDLYR